jgi:predicted nucleic acid-binding Zn ribbon protein
MEANVETGKTRGHDDHEDDGRRVSLDPVPMMPSTSEVPAESVRTLLVGSLCSVCGRAKLRGRQTVCSARCRRIRSRQRQDDVQRARDDELHLLALAARQAIEALERRLASHP